MTREQRSAQIWSLLAYAATRRQMLTYELVGKLIGAPTVALGGWLEPIQSLCLIRGIPPLTVLVVSESTGLPGSGFTGAAEIPKALAEVFAFDWLSMRAPQPEEFAAAVKERPSRGVAGEPARQDP